MDGEKCHILIPQHDIHLTEDGETSGCLRPSHHYGEHVCKFPEGHLHDTDYVAWERDNECEDPDDCECFVWRYISDKKAEELIKDPKKEQ